MATGIVDTTGYVDPRTANITQSSSVELSHAVCDAFVKVAFSPAAMKGQKVPLRGASMQPLRAARLVG